MIKMRANLLALAAVIIPVFCFSQSVSVSRMLLLQKSSLLQAEDEIETDAFKFDKITTLAEADSAVFNLQIKNFIDSLKAAAEQKNNTVTPFYLNLANTRLGDPAWLEYRHTGARDSDDSLINTITIKLPKFYVLTALCLHLNDVEQHNFQKCVEYSFTADSIYKSIVRQIKMMKVIDASSYIKFESPFITKVYKLANQVIVLSKINAPAKFYSVEVYSKSDYDYLNQAEIGLKGKVDFIH